MTNKIQSNGAPLAPLVPFIVTEQHNTLAAIITSVLEDGNDFYTNFGNHASLSRGCAARALRVVADWTNGARFEVPEGVAPARRDQLTYTLLVNNEFENGIAHTMGSIMKYIAVKSQQPQKQNLPLNIVNYDRNSLIDLAVSSLSDAHNAKDSAKAAHATRKLICYLIMLLTLAKDAHNFGEGTAAHWSMKEIIGQIIISFTNPEYEQIIKLMRADHEPIAKEREKLRNELHEANETNKRLYDDKQHLQRVAESRAATIRELQDELQLLKDERNKLIDTKEVRIGKPTLEELDVGGFIRNHKDPFKLSAAHISTAKIGNLQSTAMDIQSTVTSTATVKTDENGVATGYGLLSPKPKTDELPSFKPPQHVDKHKEITKNREVYAFYGNVTININEGK